MHIVRVLVFVFVVVVVVVVVAVVVVVSLFFVLVLLLVLVVVVVVVDDDDSSIFYIDHFVGKNILFWLAETRRKPSLTLKTHCSHMLFRLPNKSNGD